MPTFTVYFLFFVDDYFFNKRPHYFGRKFGYLGVLSHKPQEFVRTVALLFCRFQLSPKYLYPLRQFGLLVLVGLRHFLKPLIGYFTVYVVLVHSLYDTV